MAIAIRNTQEYLRILNELEDFAENFSNKEFGEKVVNTFETLATELNRELNLYPRPSYTVYWIRNGINVPTDSMSAFKKYIESLDYKEVSSTKKSITFENPLPKTQPQPEPESKPEPTYSYIIGERIVATKLSPRELKLIREATSYWYSDYTDEDLIGYLVEFDYATTTEITKEVN